MKSLRSIILILASCLAIAFFTTASSCRPPQGTAGASYSQDGTATVNAGLDLNTNVNVSATGQYNVSTGNWAAGFVITFRDVPPKYQADQLLALGGDPHEVDAQPARTWYFRNVRNPADPTMQKALSIAATAGVEFSVTKY